MSPTPPPASSTDDAFARELAPGLRSVVEATAPISLDEVRALPGPVRLTTGPSTLGWRLAAAAAVVLVLIGVGVAWRARDSSTRTAGPPATGALLPIPAHPTGPVAAENTGASTAESEGGSPVRWDVVRTGADDRQLVVSFDGATPCTTAYRAEVTETSESVRVDVFPAASTGGDCPAITAPSGTIGIELAEPLGNRRLEGSRPVIGSDVTSPLVVLGEGLATLTWPAGTSRATTESLIRGLGPDSYVWTQGFVDSTVVIEPPEGSSDVARNPGVMLEQWFGATPIDAGAGVQACRFQQPETTEPTEVGGAPATLFRCASTEARGSDRDGAIAVMWMDGADRLMVRAEPGTMDVAGLLALAGSVRRGG